MTVKREHIPGKEEDTTYVYTRAEDRSFWMRSAAWAEKYKILFWAGFLLVTAAGFGFKTPQQVFSEIHAEIDTLKIHEVVAAREREKLERKIDILLRLRCYEIQEKRMTTQALLVGLDCEKILRGDP